MAGEDAQSRPRPVLGLVAIALIVLLMAAYGTWQWYSDEYLEPSDDELDKELSTSSHSYVELTIFYNGKNHTAVLELNEEKAPKTCANFRHYVESGFYDETVFHRVIPDFVVQGGGKAVDGTSKEPDWPALKHENTGLRNVMGSLAMARQEGPNTASSQWFVNVVDNPSLNPGGVDEYGYVVFGRVYENFPLFSLISGSQTDDSDEPVEPVILYDAHMQ